MRRKKVDIREQLVAASLKQLKLKLVSGFIHSEPSNAVDNEGIDFLLILHCGLLIPLQIKAGKQTVGVVLPIFRNLMWLPQRLEGRVSLRMLSKLNTHRSKHRSIKAVLFVKLPDGYDEKRLEQALKTPEKIKDTNLIEAFKEIAREIKEIYYISIKHFKHDYRKEINEDIRETIDLFTSYLKQNQNDEKEISLEIQELIKTLIDYFKNTNKK